MRTIILAAITVLTVLSGSFASVAPASAYEYPYCVQGKDLGFPGDCSYRTYAQCMASASGRLAACGVNPRTAFKPKPRMRIVREY
jgi:hypothetical protein